MIDRGMVRGLALAGAFALAVGACGGSSASPAASSGGGATQAASTPAATASTAPAASTSSGDSGNAISALSDLSSYKVKLAITSKGTKSGIAAMGNITMSGIVVLKPAKASDITMSLGGSAPGDSAASSGLSLGLRMVEVNGKSYVDMGTGTLTESTDSSQTSMADSLAPDKLLGETASYLKDMKSVGDEQKNGIATSHYHADDTVLKEAATGLSMLGLTNATWNWDVWTAKDGGYVVSYQLKGTDSTGAELSMTLDISDVNSSSNVVKGP